MSAQITRIITDICVKCKLIKKHTGYTYFTDIKSFYVVIW